MGVPTKKRTKQQKRERRGNISLSGKHVTKCAKCGTERMPHRACPSCGYYKGRDVLHQDAKAEHKKKRQKKHDQKQSS